MRSNRLLRGLAGTLALVAGGCGSADGLVTSTGRVTCDGQPVATGAISFHPLEGNTAPQGARIVAGRFRIRTVPGRHRVEIVAGRPQAGAAELTPGMPRQEQYIPPRYNAASTLDADVARRGRNAFTFDLSTAQTEEVRPGR
jgi:hypothetical protein